MDKPRAVVIGSGIGGLTAAVALHDRGWRVTVLERAASLEPVGAGIALAPNSQRALDVIGMGDEIRALAAADPGQVLRNDVHQLIDPLTSFHRGRTVLVGDSAHAMAPSLGQGGNQAIEDAIVLAHHLTPDGDLGAGAAAYTADRLPRTTAVVRKSARTARLMRLTSAPAVATRDALTSLASRFVPTLILRTFDGIADWQPPRPTYAAPREADTAPVDAEQ
ncbi:FAD-dependent monooxygenase [Streptomyces sp. NPDC088135]|uniref:FAD-dependent oxidoreductase n=1 Tax=Streptomyces sp. NPDC088135 TaxID=3160993 RepID=UPI0034351F3F